MFDGDALRCVTRLATDKKRTAEQYAVEIYTIFSLKGADLSSVDGAVISSVVPELTSAIRGAVRILTNGVEAKVLGPGLKSGMNIRIDNPAQLGADLVAGAVGAKSRYPLPCLVLDLGTATKISVIDSNGVYRGCTIGAGIGVSMNALAGSASLLHSIELGTNECPVIGTNTVASMQAGFILGTACMLDGLCERIEEKLGEEVKSIVATGGLAEHVIRHCRKTVSYEPDLVLYGLKDIYDKNA